MPDSVELPEGVERLRIKICPECGKPSPQTGGHIHDRGFSPVKQVAVVLDSDLPAILAAERERWVESLSWALTWIIGEGRMPSDVGGLPSDQEAFDKADALVTAAFDAMKGEGDG